METAELKKNCISQTFCLSLVFYSVIKYSFFYFFICSALPSMMQWVRTQKPGESGINIITADFVELGDFISTVIKLNYLLDEEDSTT